MSEDSGARTVIVNEMLTLHIPASHSLSLGAREGCAVMFLHHCFLHACCLACAV